MSNRAGPCCCLRWPCAAGTGLVVALPCLPASAAEWGALAPDRAVAGPLFVVLTLAVALGLLARTQRRLRAVEADLRAEAERREQAEREALTDPLTRLLNRRGLAASFARRRQPLDERDLVVTLLAFEPDQLARVREIEGPEVAETLLARLARVLPDVLRGEDDAGRLDGDRFLLLISAPRYAHPCERVARRLQEAVAAAPELHWLGEPMSLSVGVAQVTGLDKPFEAALGEAESALAAGREGREGRVAIFRPAVTRLRAGRSVSAHAAAEALRTGGVGLAYQPVVAVESRRIVAVEALPSIAESKGSGTTRPLVGEPDLAERLARRALEVAVADAGRLRRQGLTAGRLSLNVVEGQLADPDFAEALLDQLMLEGLSAREVMLEVEEQTFLSRRLPDILETLERLTAAGADYAIDAFGAGYAAMMQLRDMPPHWIKLDPSMVSEIAADPAAREIAAAALGMARALGCRTVAEGVETDAVAAAAAELGFDCAQGSRYCAPVSFAELKGIARSGLAA